MSVDERDREDDELRRVIERQIREKDPEVAARLRRIIAERADVLDRLSDA